MAGFTTSSGQTSSGLRVSAGETGLVLSGGTATAITVLAGGQIDLRAGGQDGSVVLSGGSEFVSAGGIANGATVENVGREEILSGGGANFTVVSNGGQQTVFGNASFATISAGGSQSVSSGGTVIATTVLTGGAQTVFKGGTANFTVVTGYGGYEYISAGGLASHTELSSAGQEDVFAGGLAVSTTMASNGIDSEVVFSGGTTSDSNLGAGNFQYVLAGGSAISSLVGAASTEYVTGNTTATQIGSGGAEFISAGAHVSATTVLGGGMEVVFAGAQVSNTLLSLGGAIDISDLTYSSGGSATLLAGVLTVQEGVASYTQSLAGSYANEFFQPSADSNGGTLVTLMANPVGGTPCYCRGTRILAEHGEVPVESLRIGERLITGSGAARPVIWIGRRSYAGPAAVGDPDILPVCIRAGALADCIPRRDLFVSPMHAMAFEHYLIPAAALINGRSIVQVEVVERVDYFHVELESHDVIVAEGALSESFVDDNSRLMFDNAAEYRRRYPDAPRRPARYCAPRLEAGEMLEAIRRRLAARVVPQSTGDAPDICLQGRLDLVERGRICGWARNAVAPDQPVRLRVVDNGVAIGEVVADRHRADLAAAGYGHGCHAFEWIIPGGLAPAMCHRIEVRSAETAQTLPNCPQILEPVPATVIEPTTIGGDDAWRGSLDVVTRERIAGWAQDGAQPDAAVALQILDHGALIGQVLANAYRPDLAAAGIGQGWHSFDFTVPAGLPAQAQHVIEVRRERDGRRLGEPTVIEPAESFDAGLERSVAQAVAAAATSAEQERVLSFMLTQTDRLLQLRADREAQRDTRRTRAQARRRSPRAAIVKETVRRALVVDQRRPDPQRDGGSSAILSHMRALQRLGYSVSFVAAGEMGQPGAALPAGMTDCHAPFYASVEDVLRRQAGCFDLVYLHRVDIAERYLALARTYAPGARILYNVADLHHLRLARQAAVEERPELLTESRRVRLAECTAAWSADAVLCHSPVEVGMLRQAVPEAQVYQVPWDVAPVSASTAAFAHRSGVAFVGTYAHAPNLDAARFLVQSVMPLVWRADASITCWLVGSEMPASIRQLERPGVMVLGQVGDLQREVFDQVRLSVAPLRYGAGLKGKVLDSLAAGVPGVMSDIAAEGLPLSPVLREWVAEDAPGLAALICRLHTDATAHHAAAAAGQSLIAAHFTADMVATALQAAIDGRH